jgi:hypothetical protein
MMKTVAIAAVVTVAILMIAGHVAPVRKVFGL